MIKQVKLMKKFLLLSILILPLLIVMGCEDTITVTQPSQYIEGIQVTGTGSAFGKPDIAILRLGVSTERKSVEEAREEAAVVMQRLIDSLKNNGIDENDLQTKNFSIQPQYDYIDGKMVLRGYRVTNTVSAKIRSLDKVGEIIDDAANAGGDIVQIQSIQFSIDDPKKLKEQARIEAMKDAKSKAETLAEEGGVKIGKPISISESSGTYMPTYNLDEKATAGGGTTPIETGELEVSVTVTVIYEIE